MRSKIRLESALKIARRRCQNRGFTAALKKSYNNLTPTFPKLDVDTRLDLCYINNKSLHGLFCKNVHVFDEHETSN